MANLLNGLLTIILEFISIYRTLLLIYFLMSWLPGAYQSKPGQILMRICEPYVGFFRQFIPPIGMISLAGLVALLSLTLVQNGVIVVFKFLIRLFI